MIDLFQQKFVRLMILMQSRYNYIKQKSAHKINKYWNLTNKFYIALV